MSSVDVCFVGIENYVLGSSFSQSTFQKGGVCMYICNDVSFILIFLNIAKKKFWKYVQYKL
jgi:hypothetical protein